MYRPRPPRLFRFAWHPTWHPRPTHDLPNTEPCILLVHGLMAGRHMQKHWLKRLRDEGFLDVTLYSNHRRLSVLEQHVMSAAQQGRPIVLMGYSQGGFEVLKLARRLAQNHISVEMLVMVAAGGMGRIYPAQWGVDARRVPHNVKYALHAYAEGDWLGTDPLLSLNHLRHHPHHTKVTHLCFAKHLQIDHLHISRADTARKRHPLLEQQLWQPMLDRLHQLRQS